MHSSWYRPRKYIICLDLGKVSGAGPIGLNTKARDLPTLNFKDCDADGAVDSVPTRVFCALNYDCVLPSADSGIQRLDQCKPKSYSKIISKQDKCVRQIYGR